jgi:hypothetical protein
LEKPKGEVERLSYLEEHFIKGWMAWSHSEATDFNTPKAIRDEGITEIEKVTEQLKRLSLHTAVLS